MISNIKLEVRGLFSEDCCPRIEASNLLPFKFIRAQILEQQIQLSQPIIKGKEIELNNGRKFTSDLQYNADKRDVEFVRTQSLKQEQSGEKQQQRNSWVDADGNPKRITKWKDTHFTEQQIADYQAGKKIEIANVTDKQGQPCTVFLQFNKEKQRPVTEYHYADNKKVVGVAEESRTQYAVNNQGKTNEATKNITDPLQKGQTAPKNEHQQAQQRSSRSASEGTRKNPRGPKV